MPKKATQTKKVQNHIYKHQLKDQQGFFLIVSPFIAVKNGYSCEFLLSTLSGERANNSKIYYRINIWNPQSFI